MTNVYSVTRIIISNVETIVPLSKVRVAGIFLWSNERVIFSYMNSDFANYEMHQFAQVGSHLNL